MRAGARHLADLCRSVAEIPSSIGVTDISLDSRTVVEGGLFLACAGRRTHGLSGLSEALSRGANAVLWEPAQGVVAPSIPAGTYAQPIEKLSSVASYIADQFFDQPSEILRVAGVTGTNGKTTTTWLLAQALSHCASPAAYIGTLGVGMAPDAVIPSEYTTADAVSVQRQLSVVREAGVQYVAMEVSSHALDQHRVAGVRFRVVAFTNLTRDHLDYHGTMEAYGAAKAHLFDMPRLEAGVINVDDAFGAELARRHATRLSLTLIACSAAGAAVIDDIRSRVPRTRSLVASNIKALQNGLSFIIEYREVGAEPAMRSVIFQLIGEFNVENVLVTLGLLRALGVAFNTALLALGKCSAPPGRMEALTAPGKALAIVDYAHTPDALTRSLRAARAHCRGKLHLVFGCGGDRDPGKRPMMAGVAAAMADGIVITDDNPRSESPVLIAADIVAGFPKGIRATVIHDRAEAIRHALVGAREGDVVLVAGKGHERYQIVGAERRPFSDRQIIQSAYRQSTDGIPDASAR
ncbi:MAG: UDP-N-acetylmuramoyl-L-alanyl-D-glutamate--2,6-diaminopimelate ligase [Gammaproteobacteria bacterium]|nr:UDP-N-acetylmuramoyl-L-alanyl-D-glutamate--2,6-diaminopimelate ligase [Gammaproteobacteria bacterium]